MSDRSKLRINSTEQDSFLIFSYVFPEEPDDPQSVIAGLVGELEAGGFGNRFLILQNRGSWELHLIPGGIVTALIALLIAQNLGINIYGAFAKKFFKSCDPKEKLSEKIRTSGNELIVSETMSGQNTRERPSSLPLSLLTNTLDTHQDVSSLQVTYGKSDGSGEKILITRNGKQYDIKINRIDDIGDFPGFFE
jgi:hypothetical protein